MRFCVIIGLFLILPFFSCDNKDTRQRETDVVTDFKAKMMTDSIIRDAQQRVADEQQKVSEESSPVKVLSAKLSTDEYGSKDIVVRVKNESGQTIDGIKVRWTLKNNFGEVVHESYNGGISQEVLRSGKSATYRWSIYATTATKVAAYVYEVHFRDGETWSAK